MSDEIRGTSIRRRREALGIFTQREFERATARVGAKVPRASIAKAEAGTAADRTYLSLEAALDRLEEETDDLPASGDEIEFRLSGNFGVDVVVKGPVADLDAIEASVTRLIQELKTSGA